jgi:hypothetical protein
MDNIEQRIQNIEKRNAKVEQDKAWEISSTRRWMIMILTYFIAAWFMYLIKIENYWTNALVPVIGYLLSTLSIPIVRKYWTKIYYNNHEKI